MSGMQQAWLVASTPIPPVHTVSFSPTTVTGNGTTTTAGGAVAATTENSNSSVSGGVGPFTYAWSYISGTTATVNSPTSVNSTFTRTANAPSSVGANSVNGVYRLTVTDLGNGSLTATADLTVNTTHTFDPIEHTVSFSAAVTGYGQTNVASASVAATTGAAAPTVNNGVGPFTYAWSYVSGITATVNSPTSGTSTFSRTAAVPATQGTNTYNGVYRLTVTDTGNGGYTAFADLTVTTYHTLYLHTVSPSGSAYDAGSTGSPGGSVAITTNSVTANVSGGIGGFTYSWARLSGDTYTINSPTSASTTFSKTAGAPSVDGNCNHFAGVYRCTVTDVGNGSVTASADFNVSSDHCYTFA